MSTLRSLLCGGWAVVLSLVILLLGKSAVTGQEGAAFTPKEIALYQALNSRVTVDFRTRPLSNVFAFFEKRTQGKISFRTDNAALKKAGINLDSEVDFMTAYKLSVRTILRKILGDHKLTYNVKDGVLIVTTPENRAMETKTYHVAALLQATNPARSQAELDRIVRLLAPPSWKQGNKGNEPSLSINAAKQSMTVRQSAEVQEQVARLLLEMGVPGPIGTVALPGLSFDSPYTSEEISLRRALNSTFSPNFRANSLQDVFQYLNDKTKGALTIWPDADDVQAGKIDRTAPVTLNGKKLSIGTILRKILDDQKLTCHIEDGIVIVTAAGNKFMDVKVYNVAGSLDVKNLERCVAELEKVVRTVAPKSWEEGKKGAGPSLASLSHKQLLIVRQSLDVHVQIERLLIGRGARSPFGNANLSGVDLDAAAPRVRLRPLGE